MDNITTAFFSEFYGIILSIESVKSEYFIGNVVNSSEGVLFKSWVHLYVAPIPMTVSDLISPSFDFLLNKRRKISLYC